MSQQNRPVTDRGQGLDRRSFLQSAAAVGATSALPSWGLRRREAPAQAVIQIFLQGGMSHIDTFDPKPDAPADVRGPFSAIDTKLDGVQFSRLCPSLAKVADKLVVMRSMTHTEAAHERGQANMLTGYRPSPALHYPSFGSVISHELGVRNDLPPYVCIPRASQTDLGTGYLSAAYGPFSVGGDPASSSFRVRDLAPSGGVDEARIERRRRMLAELDGGYSGASDGISATQEFYEQAWNLVASQSAREAFRIDKEPKKVADAYGTGQMGRRLLLARRLVEAGSRFVVATSGGWDHHRDIYNGLRVKVVDLDRALGALIRDLDSRGLLDTTMVLLTSEFGRTPKINQDRGRDHWPRVFSVVAAGGGLKRGHAHGTSDATGAEPATDAISPADLSATMFHQMGIDPEKRLMSPGDRPIDIVRGGRVLREIIG